MTSNSSPRASVPQRTGPREMGGEVPAPQELREGGLCKPRSSPPRCGLCLLQSTTPEGNGSRSSGDALLLACFAVLDKMLHQSLSCDVRLAPPLLWDCCWDWRASMTITQQLSQQPTVATADCIVPTAGPNAHLKVTSTVSLGEFCPEGDTETGKWDTPGFCAVAAELSLAGYCRA